MSKTLETVDLTGVEIMAADVRVYGGGEAPAEGEVYSTLDLLKIAEDSNAALALDLKAAVKIGHAAGLGDAPAAGWLENFRVAGDKLLADLKRVPKKLAGLIEAGAFRTRSPEVGPWRSQATGTAAYKAVVQGLALLGTTPPAFQTLADVTKLYEAVGIELNEEQAAAVAEAANRDALGVAWWEQSGDDSPYPLAPVKTYASAEEEAALDVMGLAWEARST